MGRSIELEIPARPEYLALVRLVVTAAASNGPSLTDARLDDLRLTVSEACANAIDAYRARGSWHERVVIRCALDSESIAVEVHDHAGGFDEGSLSGPPAPTEPARLHHERGLGIPLMRALTDAVEFRHENGGMTVRLVFGREAVR
jgi:serine/threonine-protein kinase RsbW